MALRYAGRLLDCPGQIVFCHGHRDAWGFCNALPAGFTELGAGALWSSRAVPDLTPADALAITRALRDGDLRARRLAERIEAACRAAQ